MTKKPSAICPTCGHERETFTSEEGTVGFMPPNEWAREKVAEIFNRNPKGRYDRLAKAFEKALLEAERRGYERIKLKESLK